MPTPLDHSNLKPPKTSLKGRYIALAVAVHVLLIIALSLNINWRSESPPPVLVELWTEPELPEQTPPEEQPNPSQEKPPVKPPVEPPQTQDPVNHEADIALQEQKRKEEEQRKEKERLEAEEKARLDAEKKHQDEIKRQEAEKEAQEKADAEAKEKARQDEIKRQEAEKEAQKIADEKAKEQARLDKIKREKDEAAKEKEAEAKARADQLKRLQGMTGSPDGNSTLGASSGAGGSGTSISSAYRTQLANAVRRHIVYAGDKTQDIKTEVYVATDATGRVKPESIKITKHSGNEMWDRAVVEALGKTVTLPSDNGKRPALEFTFTFSPKDQR